MTVTFEELQEQAQSLAAEDRAKLAETLLESLQSPVAEIETAWTQEIEERVAAFDRGETQTYAAEDVGRSTAPGSVKRARFIAEARREFLAEVIYFNEQQPGLGTRFTASVENAVARALAYPNAGMLATRNTRRVFLRDFPFAVVYRPNSDGITIFALAHHSRRPDYCNLEFTTANPGTGDLPEEDKTMTATSNCKINYIELPARDIEATKRFFSSAFGWGFVDYGAEYVSFQDAGLDGGFYKSDLAASTKTGSALVVLYSAELEKTLGVVEKCGGEIVKPIFSFPGGRRFHFADPNGNEFAVWSEE